MGAHIRTIIVNAAFCVSERGHMSFTHGDGLLSVFKCQLGRYGLIESSSSWTSSWPAFSQSSQVMPFPSSGRRIHSSASLSANVRAVIMGAPGISGWWYRYQLSMLRTDSSEYLFPLRR